MSFYLDGKRHRETFTKIRDAQARKNEVERNMGRGIHARIKVKAVIEDSVQYALGRLKTAGIAKPLNTVIDEYIAGQEKIGSNGSILDACDAYANNQDKVVPITTADLVSNYERYLIGQKVSEDHIEKTARI